MKLILLLELLNYFRINIYVLKIIDIGKIKLFLDKKHQSKNLYNTKYLNFMLEINKYISYSIVFV